LLRSACLSSLVPYTTLFRSFSGMAGFDGFADATLRCGNTVKSVTGYAVTGNYFDLLGVQPEVGRFIHEADEHGPNSAPYVVLSKDRKSTRLNSSHQIISYAV